MTFLESLGKAFETQGIKQIAIVDDGYDEPTYMKLSETHRTRFHALVDDAIDDEENEDTEASCIAAGFGGLAEIRERIETPEYFSRLWGQYQTLSQDDLFRKLVHELVKGFVSERRDKLASLDKLEKLIIDSCNIKPEKFGSDANADHMAQYELIFLDFYLEEQSAADGGGREDQDLSRERSQEFLRKLIKASPARVPLVMLISSEAKASDLPEFRTHTKILASALHFLPKNQIENNTMRAQATILGLIKQREEVTALAKLLDLWQNEVKTAADDLMEVVRELELSDYAYLQKYRLNYEKVPLGHYLVWLFNGFLAGKVEEGLHSVEVLKLVKSLATSEDFPSRVAPTKAISDLYGAVTTSSVPMEIDLREVEATDDVVQQSDAFKPVAWAGDVFVREDVWQKAGGYADPRQAKFDYPMPEAFAVVTPACDLVPGRSDKLKTVSAIGGTLVALDEASKPTTHFLTLHEDKRFHVEWNSKWPLAIPIGAMNGSSAFEGRYRWVGRLRELYHADLQYSLVSDLGRIGLPVVPTMPDWTALRVLARINKEYEEIVSYSASEKIAWVFFQASSGTERLLHLREDLVWELRDIIHDKISASAGSKSLTRLKAHIDSEEFVKFLQHPIRVKGEQIDNSDVGVRITKGVPNVHSNSGQEKCDKAVLFVFGSDKADVGQEVTPGVRQPTSAEA